MTNTPSFCRYIFLLHLSPLTLALSYKGEGMRKGLLKQKKPPKGLFPDIIQEQASGGSANIKTVMSDALCVKSENRFFCYPSPITHYPLLPF